MMKLNRRKFIKALGVSGLFAGLPIAFRSYAAPEDYHGKLLITVQAEGGFDVTSFCDPKENVSGEPEINRWARNNEIREAGNLRYAPVAGNQAFFEKYYRDMLVINGIDAQTNSHSAGVTHNWSGRISAGYPSLTAIFSSVQAPNLPVSYINNGGYAETAGLIRYTRMSEVGQLGNIIYPNTNRWNPDSRYLHQSDWQRIIAARNQRLDRLVSASSLTPQQAENRSEFKSAIDNSSVLRDFASSISNAGELQQPVTSGNQLYSDLKRQIQIALLAMKSGVSSAADVYQGGFDTHENHDALQYWNLQQLTEGVDYLWDYAETLGLADRLIVYISSDFGRTPHYNDTNGKDHWPIGSAIVMERDVNWTNRAVGLTDEGHNVVPISTADFSEASRNGEIIYPKHVMYNMRRYLNLDGHVNTQPFPFSESSAFDFFSV